MNNEIYEVYKRSNGVILLSRSTLISILIICIVLIFFFMLYERQAETGNTFYSERFNEYNQKKTGSNYIKESNKEIIDSMDSSGLSPKSLDSEQLGERKDVAERRYQRDEFQAGINLLVYEHPNISNAQKLFKHLRKLGINSVAIVFPFFQSDWQADQVMIDPAITPIMAEIKALIVSAHAEDLNVMLRPILDEKSIMSSGHWRGTIKPKNPEAWFNSYRSLLLTYAELAQKTNVEIFNIGTEFNSLQHNKYSDEWLRIIEEVRQVYQGELIYSFNWDCFREISSNEFVSMLDYVGIDAYFPLEAPDNASVEELEEAWGKWMSEIKRRLSNEPIVITEVGVIPISGAYRKPYEWSMPGGKLDWQAQANYYEATYSVWQSMIEGIYWWSVTVSKPDPNVIDYSPLKKPTEEVIERIFLKKTPEDIKD